MLTLCLRPAGRLYAMQTGMKLDSKSPECRKFLIKLMDQLEGVSTKHTTDILPVSCWRAPPLVPSLFTPGEARLSQSSSRCVFCGGGEAQTLL